MSSIEIVNGKKGFHLKVDGMYISHSFTDNIKSIKNDVGIPYGATEWVSVVAIKQFWHKYMPLIISSTKQPYKSVWGNLELIKNEALSYLKKLGANSQGDLNYSTDNGIDFYIGAKDTTAIVVAIVENENNYMLYKEDLKEMSSSARTKGIKTVELHTNFGAELHSRNENPKSVGFDRIVKKSFG